VRGVPPTCKIIGRLNSKIGGGGNHGGVVAEKFFGVRNKNFETMFFGGLANVFANIKIGGGATGKNNSFGFGLMDGKFEFLGEMESGSALEGSGVVGNILAGVGWIFLDRVEKGGFETGVGESEFF